MPAATTAAAAGAGSSTPPSPSLYVKNLDTRTKKPELARQLYVLFGAYGKVLDVVATRAPGMRGQAFVVFREQQSATAARRALDGFEFYGKALSIDYARTRSNATVIDQHGPAALYDPMLQARLAGTSAAGASKVTMSSAQGAARERKRGRDEEGAAEEEEGNESKVARTEADAAADDDDDDAEMDMSDSDSDAEAPAAGTNGKANGSAAAALGPPSAAAGSVPNELLFLPALSDDVSEEALGTLFGQYPGYSSVQVVPGSAARQAHAFVEFADARTAGAAREGLAGFQLNPSLKLSVEWAKRG